MWTGGEESTIEVDSKDMSLNISSGSTGGSRQGGSNCVPLMIKHILRYGEDIQVWGMPIRLITLVAILRQFDEDGNSKVSFIFEDETGVIRGVKWLNGQHTGYQCPVKLNSYARVYGSIRKKNVGEYYIHVVHIQPIEHIHELSSHLMEVTLMCLEGAKNVDQVTDSGNTFVSHSANMTHEEVSSCLTKDQAIIYEIIKNSISDYGAERNEMKSKIPAYLLPKFEEILNFLADEGHVYTTKTDDFFKAV